MNKRLFIIYTSYLWTKLLLGLTFHPYKSVKETVKRPILFPVLFSPFVAVILLFIVAKIGSIIITIYGFTRGLVALFLSTTLISIIMWQILLLYLFVSFVISALRNKF